MGITVRILLLVKLIFLCFFCSSSIKVGFDNRAITIDGVRRIINSGAIHYPRSTVEMWPDLIQKAKDGGLDAIETYIFWDISEPRRGEYHFTGNRDFIHFLKIIKDAGLYAILRIGPYVCAEWNYGGFPVWLNQLPGIEFRTDNQVYKDEMQKFTTKIVDMVKKEQLFAPQGGPIILAQIENEYGNIMDKFGEAGKTYIKWCATMAESLNVDVPWIMCQQSDAPAPMINTCNGYYCDNFKPNSPNSPKMWTENWAGWYQMWGESVPHRPAEDVAYAVAKFFLTGGTLQSYYMYHGGTNFGHTSGGPYITTSYDYDAPIDENGDLKLPKWGHLKVLHSALKKMEKALTSGEVDTSSVGTDLTMTKYTADGIDPGCFIENTNNVTDTTLSYERRTIFLPARSISILPDCKREVFNTAKVSNQHSVIEKKTVGSVSSTWGWRFDMKKHVLKGKKTFSKSGLLEQVSTTLSATDYLWYMTSFSVHKSDPWWVNKVTLRVTTNGHALHAFVNGHLVGTQHATNGQYQFVFEGKTSLLEEANTVTLLSVTVGLANYGARFEKTHTGIVGPVQIIGDGNRTMDLSNNAWTYKIGLNGEAKQVYLPISPHKATKWNSGAAPKGRPLVWYKTTFEVPTGEDRLALDLKGMGKGEAWVNGNSIGRFWPAFTAPTNTCLPCDYRQTYEGDHCRTGCGEPSQRWYHVPRSFTTVGKDNVLVMFEEIGGDPSNVKLVTPTVTSIYAVAYEGSKLELSCHGRTFSGFQFMSFGDPKGTYGSFSKGSCESTSAMFTVNNACEKKTNCTIEVVPELLGSTGCASTVPVNRLAIQASC